MTSSRTQFCSLGVKWFPGRPKFFELNFTLYLKGRNSKTIWPCVRHHRTEKFINICTFCKMVTMQFEYHICISKLCFFLESVLHSYMRVILWSNILLLTLISSLTGLRVISSKIARDCRINCRNGIHTCWSIRKQSTCVINPPEYVFILLNSEGDVNRIHYPDMEIPGNTWKSMMIQRRRIRSRCFRRRQQLVSGFHHSGNACCPHFSPHQIPSRSNHDALRRMRASCWSTDSVAASTNSMISFSLWTSFVLLAPPRSCPVPVSLNAHIFATSAPPVRGGGGAW